MSMAWSSAILLLSFLGVPLEEKKPMTLPQGLVLSEEGPQEYVFTCEYFQTDAGDEFIGKHRIVAKYARNLAGGKAVWSDAVLSGGRTLDGDYDEGKPLDYLEGFTYDPSLRGASFMPSFFRGFPVTATASYAKNLVWDTHMMEDFGQGFFGSLKLNQPYTPQGMSDAGVPLAGMGTFRNRKVELTWLGLSERNGESCAMIRYQAYFNRFQMGVGASKIAGLSHYWGEIWVSLVDKQIEHGTLHEHVSMRIGASKESMTPFRVFRVASFEKLHQGK